MEADALASAISVLGYDAGVKLLANNSAVRVINDDKIQQSPNFPTVHHGDKL